MADGDGLENRYGCKLIKGSNPLPSAHVMSRVIHDRLTPLMRNLAANMVDRYLPVALCTTLGTMAP